MSNTDLASVCQALEDQYADKYNLSVMVDTAGDEDEVAVYLPLNEANEVDPPESKREIEQFFTERRFSTRMEEDGLLIATPAIQQG